MAEIPSKLQAAAAAKQRRNAIEKGDTAKAKEYLDDYNNLMAGETPEKYVQEREEIIRRIPALSNKASSNQEPEYNQINETRSLESVNKDNEPEAQEKSGSSGVRSDLAPKVEVNDSTRAMLDRINNGGGMSQNWDRPSEANPIENDIGADLVDGIAGTLGDIVTKGPDALFNTGGLLDPGTFGMSYEDKQKAIEDQKADAQRKQEQGYWQSGSNPATQQYEEMLAGLGYDKNAVSKTSIDYLGDALSAFSMASNPEYNPDGEYDTDFMGRFNDAVTAQREQAIDDGTISRENLTSSKMTGKQYKYYREQGIPGRDIGEINENAIYDKIDEWDEYGFMPYVPDVEAEQAILASKISEAPAKILNDGLGQSRKNSTDYTIKYNKDGQEIELSGKDFDNGMWKFQEQMDAYNNGDSRFFDPEADHTGTTGFVPKTFSIAVEDGDPLTVPADGYKLVDEGVYPDGGEYITMQFSDGQVVTFDGRDDLNNSVSTTEWREAGEGDQAQVWLPSYQVGDTTLNYFDVMELVSDDLNNPDRNQNISYDFGDFNWGIPDRLNGGLFEGDWVGNLLPNTYDLIVQSAPYFFPQVSVPLALSNMSTSAKGIDPQSLKLNGESTMLAGINPETGESELTNDMILGSMLGNAIMPATEFGLGRIGGQLFKQPLKGLTNKIGERTWTPLAEHAIGTFGEGMEEIPGNLFENLSANGFENWYANEKTDEDGNVIYDSAGKPIYDESTSAFDRLGNFVGDAPEAFKAGSWLGFLFGLPSAPGAVKSAKDIYDINAADKAAGMDVFRNGTAKIDADQMMDEAYRRRYLGEDQNNG